MRKSVTNYVILSSLLLLTVALRIRYLGQVRQHHLFASARPAKESSRLGD
ncbi:MAG: hypothetical protein HY644_12995 [Acidobacteria bacterium]|nr:hypothetical protein [Acidobacteriota bacterium]